MAVRQEPLDKGGEPLIAQISLKNRDFGYPHNPRHPRDPWLTP